MQREWFEQKRVKLADLGFYAEDFDHYLEHEAETESEPGKALRYREAMRAGTKFSPVVWLWVWLDLYVYPSRLP